MDALLRSRVLPAKMREDLMEIYAEAKTFNVEPVEAALLRFHVPNMDKRKQLYGCLLSGTPVPPEPAPSKEVARSPTKELKRTQRGHRSDEATAKRSRLEEERRQRAAAVAQVPLLEPENWNGFTLVGDSHLRRIQSGVRETQLEDGSLAAGWCFGGATIREVKEVLEATTEHRRFIVLVGQNDVMRHNKMSTMRLDVTSLLSVLKTRADSAVIVVPPLVFRDRGLNDRIKKIGAYMVDNAGQVPQVRAVLNLNESLSADGKIDSAMFAKDGLHLSAKGYEQLSDLLKKEIERDGNCD